MIEHRAKQPPDASRHDSWASGDSYDAYIGRWSCNIAPLFLKWVEAGTRLRWLDVGCGTGALSQAIIENCDPKDLFGVEPAKAFRERARAVISDPRARFEAGDLAGAEERLFDFLCFRFGGVTRYVEERGHPRLRMRHMPFRIGEAERDRWLELMEGALRETEVPEAAAVPLTAFFTQVADFMRNA